MIKNFFALCFLFLSIQTFSQNIDQLRSIANFSSESELLSYIEKTKTKGLSLDQVEKLALTQGAKPDEIQLLRKLWNSNNNQLSNNNAVDVITLNSSFGNKENEENEDNKEIKRFGSDFFNNKNISEAPQLFVATPLDYRLGPGDELTINLFGSSENTYSVQITRDGTVKFDRAPPIYLSGLSINSAKKRLIKSLSKLYTGLLSSDELNKVELDLSLSKARSVVVNITGQVVAPGTYTISGFSSVLNALYAAGGPNNVGSYRNIKIIRYGKVYKTIDLYDYFVGGSYPTIYLRDQDVILVESYSNLVYVDNGFKINGLFEVKEEENLSHLIKFSGGFLSNTYKDKVFVNRINSYSRSTIEYNSENYDKSKLMDGDLISAKSLTNFIENSVSIEGSVYLPGLYDISRAKTVTQLLEASKGLTPDAISKAFLYRKNNGVQDEIVSLDLRNEEDLALLLIDQDRLVVSSYTTLNSNVQIRVEGEVNNPQTYQFKRGMTVRDAILIASGFNSLADKSDISVIRNVTSENKKILTEIIDLSFDEDYNPTNNIELMPDDIVSVKKYLFYKTPNLLK
jgi:protein involved in polysaccharide export with SLBB domain